MKNTKRRSRAATYTQSVSQSPSSSFLSYRRQKLQNIITYLSKKKKTPSLYTKVTKFKKSESSFSLISFPF